MTSEKQEKINNIRIFDKKGEIAFSNSREELGRRVGVRDSRCRICHKVEMIQPKVESEPGQCPRITVWLLRVGE